MKKNFLSFLIGNLILQGVNFFVLPLIGRYFSPVEYSIIPIIEIYLVALSWISSLMVVSGMARYYFDKRFDRQVVVNNTVTLLLIVGAIALAITLVATSFLSFLQAHGRIILLATVHQLLFQLYALPLEVLKLEQKPFRYVILGLVKGVVYLALFAVFTIVLRRDIASIYEAQVISSALALLVSWLLCEKARRVRLNFDKNVIRTILAFSLPLILSGASMYVINSSDRLFVKYMLGDELLGNYAFMYKIISLVSIILVVPTNSVWHPFFFKNMENELLLKATTRKVFLLVLTAALILILGLICNYQLVLQILSKGRFSIPVEVFTVCGLGYVIYGLLFVLATAFHLRERTTLLVKFFLTGSAVNLLLNWLLIPVWGLMGAAVATLAAFATIITLYLIWLRKLFPVNFAVRDQSLVIISFGAVALIVMFYNPSLLVSNLLLSAYLLSSYLIVRWGEYADI